MIILIMIIYYAILISVWIYCGYRIFTGNAEIRHYVCLILVLVVVINDLIRLKINKS